MNTNKLAYWVALGVLAFGLSSEYKNGKFPAIHHAAQQAGDVLCRMATRAEQTVALVRLLSAPAVSAPAVTSAEAIRVDVREQARAQAEMAREQILAQAEMMREQAHVQAEIARAQAHAQAKMARAQAHLRRAEFRQIQWPVSSQFKMLTAGDHRLMVVCPRIGVKVVVRSDANIPDLSSLDLSNLDLSKLEVGDSF